MKSWKKTIKNFLSDEILQKIPFLQKEVMCVYVCVCVCMYVYVCVCVCMCVCLIKDISNIVDNLKYKSSPPPQ